ncbi:hypothetical protein [uncultured Alsobacter sp.]|uniref:hypothetical protein n=1 Tax=uncultured Alsobacter sp. TaxID=1748258 RepID=UPI0025CC1EDF|nr:hypothetical protein [uncultured Alsobacter sp.]
MPSTQQRPTRLPRQLEGVVVLNGAAPDVELAIGEHMFKGIAFAVDYEAVPDPERTALQDQHLTLMRSLQDLLRQRGSRLH